MTRLTLTNDACLTVDVGEGWVEGYDYVRGHYVRWKRDCWFVRLMRPDENWGDYTTNQIEFPSKEAALTFVERLCAENGNVIPAESLTDDLVRLAMAGH